MAYTAIHKDTGYGYYGGNSFPHSEATPQPSSYEIDHTIVPPSRCVPTAALSAHSSGYAPQWNTPTLHSSFQDQQYGLPVPYNDVASSYSVWTDAQQSASFAPMRTMNAVTAYQNQTHNQDTGNAPNGFTTYHEDNRIPAGKDLNGRFSVGVQSGSVVDYGPTLAQASTHSAAGNEVQVSVPDDEAPKPSESLKTLSKHYVLGPETHIETVHIAPSRCGYLKIVITLEAADCV